MKKPATYLLLLFLVLTSCEKKNSTVEFEQEVFDEVFINIVDSTYTDKRLYTRFPTKFQENDPSFTAETKAIENDTLNLIIAVAKRFKNTKIPKNKKFIFKDYKELPEVENYQNWTEKYKRFIGVMYFSYITFDKAKENGSLEVSYSCGAKCGLGYKVYLKKINKKWKVIKTENTWIS
ncbi:hypothetical protein [Chryseobacterium chendengshani]|uniref:hypothetical protein n=1 Tax=Chryseobacterium sp. LJ756 TaxID=2864113 RepID=UPI001C63D9C1|nr:hypothetical protein [Chryseobacterium sp. LJ756]